MSKPRYKWWGFVKAIIRAYPDHCRELAEIHSQSLTQSFDAMPHGSGGVNRSAESVALRTLPAEDLKEYESVVKALDSTHKKKDGRERVEIINLVFFAKSHTLQGAAIACNVSYGTAKNWHNEFIRKVAQYYGLY